MVGVENSHVCKNRTKSDKTQRFNLNTEAEEDLELVPKGGTM